jgi:Associated with zinc fingers
MAHFTQPTTPTTQLETVLMPRNNQLFQENYARSQNEQILYNEWKKTECERDIIFNKFQQIQSDLRNLQRKYAELEKIVNKEEERIEYHTDEEELARETEWIRAKEKNTKKRKMDTSLSPPPKEENAPKNEQTKSKKEHQPPPVMVDGIDNFNDLHEKVSKIMNGFQIKIINNKNAKINVPDGESYRLLTKMLSEQGFMWHSYENKQNRPIKVIMKNLHHTYSKEKIVAELSKRGYKITEAISKLKWKTKEPLNMFMLVFRHDEDIKKIYEITNIEGIRVEIEPIKTSKLIPQCKNFQAYGHAQRYYAKQPRCVKCTVKHHTKDCEKPAYEKPKCIHCGESHPANYENVK